VGQKKGSEKLYFEKRPKEKFEKTQGKLKRELVPMSTMLTGLTTMTHSYFWGMAILRLQDNHAILFPVSKLLP